MITTTKDDEKIIGTMCLMDDKYMWCSYSERIVYIVANTWDVLIPIADNDIHLFDDNSCELCNRCFNFDCKYNKDKDVSYLRDVLEDVEFTQEQISHCQKNFDDITTILKDDERGLVKKLNDSVILESGYEWYAK